MVMTITENYGHKGVGSKSEITRKLQNRKKISSWNLNDKKYTIKYVGCTGGQIKLRSKLANREEGNKNAKTFWKNTVYIGCKC